MDDFNKPGPGMKKKIYVINYTTPDSWFWYEEKPGMTSFPTWGPFKSLALVEESIKHTESLSNPPSLTMSFTEALQEVWAGKTVFTRQRDETYYLKLHGGYLIDGCGPTNDVYWNKDVKWLCKDDMTSCRWGVMDE